MKLIYLAVVLFILAGTFSGCVSERHAQIAPVPPVPPLPIFTGQRLQVVVEETVARKEGSKSSFVSDDVRNNLRFVLENYIDSKPVFNVLAVVPGASVDTNVPHVSAAILSVRHEVFSLLPGPLGSLQKGYVDAKMEVRLARPGQLDMECIGKATVASSAESIILEAKQYKDWVFDDSWASVACKEALQSACDQLAARVEAEQQAPGLSPLADNRFKQPHPPARGRRCGCCPAGGETLAVNPPGLPVGWLDQPTGRIIFLR